MVADAKFSIGDYVLVKNYGRRKLDPHWYGPLQVTRVTPLSTYQLKWGDGELKEDLVHQDRLKLAKVPEGESVRKAWFAKTRRLMEALRDNSDDGLPIEPDLDPKERNIAERRTFQDSNTAYLARRDQLGTHVPPAMGTAAEARRLYEEGLRKAGLRPTPRPLPVRAGTARI
ncbi:hypothetical protein BGZ94_004762 [Podila epigama]|nr:hypothetical protein BGZ94_004762 [Podila epigama]